MESKEELEQITNCALCGNMCKDSCPVYLATGSETVTPQKKARLILYKKKTFIEDEKGFFDVMFQCAMCGACKVNCLYDNFDLRDSIQRERSEAFKKGILPDETRKRVETFTKFGNPDGERQLIQKGAGEIGYFVSCSTYNDQQLLKAVEKIFARSGEQVQEFGGADICCGAPLYYAGDLEGFKKAAEKMKGEIEQRKLRKVIGSCPTCIKMMTEIYAEIGTHLDVEFIHVVEFLAALLKEGKIKVNKANAAATFHDPCILANDIGITTAPRDIIKMLGFDIKEPVYSRKEAHCCGEVPGGRIGDNKLVNNVNAMRINELKETAADVYISACPTCKASLSNIDMKDIAELVAEQIING
jgi:Fe-S oxidoreductase